MSFSTYKFIFVFFPTVLCMYYLLGKRAKAKNNKLPIVMLLITSIVFIGMTGISAIIYIVGSAIVNYTLLQVMSVKKQKKILCIGILLNILFLGYFKYYNFFIENVNVLFHTKLALKSIILPLGISFYTFQQILLLVEYNESDKDKFSLLEYLSGILFFPRVISGPIISLQDMQRQWRQTNNILDYRNLSTGFYLFCIGLFKKVVIADTLVYFVDNGYGITSDINFWQAWCTTLCYTFQIYFDFSGYSDMAIGIARTFGIILPFNFNSPYHAESITEFWRRWHITLSKALSKLIYIPLGGNRKGVFRTCLNLMATFLISGLWHGASWTYILWGGFQGFFMVVEKVANKWIEKIPLLIRRVSTFLIVNCLWVLFRAENMEHALQMYNGMFNISKNIGEISSLGILANDGIIPFPDIMWAIYLLFIIIMLFMIMLVKKNSNDMYEEFTPNRKTMIFAMGLFVISTVHLSRLANFVYVNF